jgi:hypothetical protein
MGDLLGSLVWGAKSGQYCVIGGGSLHRWSSYYSSTCSSLDRIRLAQEDELELQDLIDRTYRGEATGFYLTGEGMLKTSSGRTVIPNDAELRRDILDKVHQTRYIVHPGNNKMYQDLKKKFWWCGMKMDIVEYVAPCHSYQLVKAEHQRPAGPLKPLDVPM